MVICPSRNDSGGCLWLGNRFLGVDRILRNVYPDADFIIMNRIYG